MEKEQVKMEDMIVKDGCGSGGRVCGEEVVEVGGSTVHDSRWKSWRWKKVEECQVIKR